jgi:hypothetical protein
VVNVQAQLRRGRNVSGALAAQLVQGLTSLLLQVVAVHALGAAGLGVFSVLYGGIILANAVASGLIGDSLTVLERSSPPIRAGLQRVAVVVTAIGAVLGCLAAGAAGLLSWPWALLLGLVVGAFIVEELARRMLMASLRFWSVVAVDLVALAGTFVALAVIGLVSSSLELSSLLLALLVGQIAGLAAGVRMFPASERWLAPSEHADPGAVLRFGGWRAAQQGLRPAALVAIRSVAIVAVGAATLGELEATRVYTAPAMLVVSGLGGYLLASYAAAREPLRTSLRRADIGAVSLFLLVLAMGVVALLLVPWTGDLVTGGDFPLDRVAVFGWALYAACTGLQLPYGGLAAVRELQVEGFLLRLLEAAGSIAAVAGMLFLLDTSVEVVPYVLAVGAVITGFAVRRLLLRGEHLRSASGLVGRLATRFTRPRPC